MHDSKRQTEALIGPPSDPYCLAARVGDPRKILVAAGHVDGGPRAAGDGEPQRAGAVKWLLRVAQTALDENRYKPHAGRIWWD